MGDIAACIGRQPARRAVSGTRVHFVLGRFACVFGHVVSDPTAGTAVSGLVWPRVAIAAGCAGAYADAVIHCSPLAGAEPRRLGAGAGIYWRSPAVRHLEWPDRGLDSF